MEAQVQHPVHVQQQVHDEDHQEPEECVQQGRVHVEVEEALQIRSQLQGEGLQDQAAASTSEGALGAGKAEQAEVADRMRHLHATAWPEDP